MAYSALRVLCTCVSSLPPLLACITFPFISPKKKVERTSLNWTWDYRANGEEIFHRRGQVQQGFEVEGTRSNNQVAGGERFSRRTGLAPLPEPRCVRPINDQKYIQDNLTFMILEVKVRK